MQYSRQTFQRKMVIIMLGMIVFGMLWWRLWQLQIVEGGRFLRAAESNRFYSLSIPAPRGVFFDRYGRMLSTNEKQYYLIQDPQRLYSSREAISSEVALQYIATDSAKVVAEYRRGYPAGNALAHMIGYLSAVTVEDLAADQDLEPTDQIGKLGLEQALQEKVAGSPGEIVVEINAQAERQRIVKQTEPVLGTSFTTTLDSALAAVSAKLLQDVTGSLVVLDADTGAVLSLVNSPSYDPNLFGSRAILTPEEAQSRQETITALFSNQDQPFFNRGVSGLYPPGSIFKLVTAVAGLETEAITAATTVLDEGVLKVGDFEYRNWLFRQYGQTDGEIALVRALARSNDIYFYKVAEWIGPDRLAQIAGLLGLGKSTGIEIGGEGIGTIPSPAWKEKNIGEPWYLGNTYHFGIGQGDVLVTPLQMASMVQALANAGTHCQPSLLELSAQDPARCQEVGVREEHINTVLQGMIEACSPGGTGFPFFERNRKVQPGDEDQENEKKPIVSAAEILAKGAVACKTGTAEFGSLNQDGSRPTHGWFVAVVEPQLETLDLEKSNQTVATTGVFSADSYQDWVVARQQQGFPKRLVILSLVESDEEQQYREGSSDAAPLVEELLNWIESGILSTDQATPDEVQEIPEAILE